jgi:hypothetical protein
MSIAREACFMQGFKLKFLGPYMQRLLRLATDAHLREELTSFPLAINSDDAIELEHRPGVHSHAFMGFSKFFGGAQTGSPACIFTVEAHVLRKAPRKVPHPRLWLACTLSGLQEECCSLWWLGALSACMWLNAGLIQVLVRLLWPKMRKRSGRLGGKGAPGSARAAILNFLSGLQPAELRPLLVMFMTPLAVAIKPQGKFTLYQVHASDLEEDLSIFFVDACLERSNQYQ